MGAHSLWGFLSWKLLLRVDMGASMTLGLGPLDDNAGLWHFWESVADGLPLNVTQAGLCLPALGVPCGMEPAGVFLLVS